MITILTVADMIEVLEGVRNVIITQHLSIFIKVASMLAAILAAWAFIKISHDYMEGQGITFWMVAKPLVMVILVCNFNTFVLRPVHYLTNVFTMDLTMRTNKAQNSWAKSMAISARNVWESGLNPVKIETTDHLDKTEAKEIEETGETRGKVRDFFDKSWVKVKKVLVGAQSAITNVRMTATNIVFSGLSGALYSGLNVLTHAIYYIQICFCYILLTIYGLLGPFVFAFSIIGNYSRGVSDWIARYIHTSFWIPVGQMVFLIGSVIMENINKTINCQVGDINVSSTNGLFGNFNIGTYMGIVMIFATAISILSVPKICSYIIESAGSGGVGRSVSNAASSAARMATKVITKV